MIEWYKQNREICEIVGAGRILERYAVDTNTSQFVDEASFF